MKKTTRAHLSSSAEYSLDIFSAHRFDGCNRHNHFFSFIPFQDLKCMVCEGVAGARLVGAAQSVSKTESQTCPVCAMLFNEGSAREDPVADSLMKVEQVLVAAVLHSVTLVVRNAVVFAMLSKEANVIAVTAAVSLMRMILMLPTTILAAQLAQLLAMPSKEESALAVTLADSLTKCPLHILPPNPVEFAMLTKMENVTVAPPADSAMRMVEMAAVPHKSQVSAMPFKEVNVNVVKAAAMLMNLVTLPDLLAEVVEEEEFAMLSKEVNVNAVRVAVSVTMLRNKPIVV
jgi:hypothetical protein